MSSPQFLLFIVALAIAVVPEALPVIATVTLSDGAMQLAKQQVVVKRLSSVEDLGNITLLCTDKTGTLTEGKMRIQKIVADDPLRLQQFAAATVESRSEAGAAQQNSYDEAFLAYIPPEIQEQARMYRQVQALPFDPERRRRCSVIEESSTHTRYLVVLGAVETLLALSDCQHQQKEQYLRKVDQFCPLGRGLRTPHMYFWMVRLQTRISSLSNSPRMRSAPPESIVACHRLDQGDELG